MKGTNLSCNHRNFSIELGDTDRQSLNELLNRLESNFSLSSWSHH